MAAITVTVVFEDGDGNPDSDLKVVSAELAIPRGTPVRNPATGAMLTNDPIPARVVRDTTTDAILRYELDILASDTIEPETPWRVTAKGEWEVVVFPVQDIMLGELPDYTPPPVPPLSPRVKPSQIDALNMAERGYLLTRSLTSDRFLWIAPSAANPAVVISPTRPSVAEPGTAWLHGTTLEVYDGNKWVITVPDLSGFVSQETFDRFEQTASQEIADKLGEVHHDESFSGAGTRDDRLKLAIPVPEFTQQVSVFPPGVTSKDATTRTYRVTLGEKLRVPPETRKLAVFTQSRDRSRSDQVAIVPWDTRLPPGTVSFTVTEQDITAIGLRDDDVALNMAFSFLAGNNRVMGDKEVPFAIGIGPEYGDIDLHTERLLRVAGDQIRPTRVNSPGGLASALLAQADDTHGLLIIFTADVTSGGVDWDNGDVAYLEPRQSSITHGNRWFNLGDSGDSGGGNPGLLLHSFYPEAKELVRNTWVDVATLTVPQNKITGPMVLMFDATADRQAGQGTISLRLMRGSTLIRGESNEVEVSGSAEHEQMVLLTVDNPPVSADAVYTVQAYFTAPNLQAEVHARELLIMRPGSVPGDGTDAKARELATAAAEAALDNKKRIDNLPPWNLIELEPAGIGGRDYPSFIDVRFAERTGTRTITDAVLTLAGERLTLDSSTPEANVASSGVLRFNISSDQRDTLKVNTEASDIDKVATLQLRLSDNVVYLYNVPFLVNNPSFASGTSGAVTPDSLLASLKKFTDPQRGEAREALKTISSTADGLRDIYSAAAVGVPVGDTTGRTVVLTEDLVDNERYAIEYEVGGVVSRTPSFRGSDFPSDVGNNRRGSEFPVGSVGSARNINGVSRRNIRLHATSAWTFRDFYRIAKTQEIKVIDVTTQVSYDALTTKDPTTLYLIVE